MEGPLMEDPIHQDLGEEFYLRLQKLLETQNILFDPAEFHGCLTGLACTGQDEHSVSSWQRVIVSDPNQDQINERLHDAITGMMALIHRDLRSTGFEFRILLPPESSDLVNRTQALADWCTGFCTGFAYDALIEPDELEPDAVEALTDIGQIAGVEAGHGDSDDQERDLFELEEYIRIGAQLIYEAVQTRSLNSAPQRATSGS